MANIQNKIWRVDYAKFKVKRFFDQLDNVCCIVDFNMVQSNTVEVIMIKNTLKKAELELRLQDQQKNKTSHLL
jgi:hypothetical protein